jgi:excinuclease ABC subunit B
LNAYDAAIRMKELERLMTEAAADLRFEDAGKYRDELLMLKQNHEQQEENNDV